MIEVLEQEHIQKRGDIPILPGNTEFMVARLQDRGKGYQKALEIIEVFDQEPEKQKKVEIDTTYGVKK